MSILCSLSCFSQFPRELLSVIVEYCHQNLEDFTASLDNDADLFMSQINRIRGRTELRGLSSDESINPYLRHFQQ